MGKVWSWSYSKLKNFETCPKRHNEVDLLRNFKDTSEQLDWGNSVHDRMAKACTGAEPLPAEMAGYQKWVDRVKAGPGELKVEQKYAITSDFKPTSWFGHDAWFRGIGDVVRLAGPVALILDWKTGKPQEDSVQLRLMAQCIFSHFPSVQRVRAEFVWLAHDCTTPEVVTRQALADMWFTNGVEKPSLINRVRAMETAAKTQTYPPQPGRLCKRYCPVVSCPHHGKAYY